MKREEAIKILKSMSDISTQGEAIDMAIESLSTKPSEGLISRADAIEVGNKIVEELSLSSIEWDDLKHWVKELFDALPSAEAVGIGRYEKAMQILREMPRYFNSIKAKQIKKIQSDAVEVVKCEKCKHYSVEGFTTLFGWCNVKEYPVDEDDFCKYGERKE